MKHLLFITIVTLITGCSTNHDYDMNDFHKMYGDDDVKVADLIEAVSKQKIYFGHQSVGYNIIDGIIQWELETEGQLQKVDTRNFSEIGDASFIHFTIGKNYDTMSKIDDFVSLVSDIPVEQEAVAFFKFCYVDVTRSTDVDELFNYYQEKMIAIRRDRPKLKLVMVTCPVTGIQKGLEGLARKILNRQHSYAVEDNIKRNEFNTKMKDEFSGVFPIFDLAGVESTLPDGTIQTYSYKGSDYPGMPDFYTSDLGHLNEYGAKVVSYNLLAFLAEEL